MLVSLSNVQDLAPKFSRSQQLLSGPSLRRTSELGTGYWVPLISITGDLHGLSGINAVRVSESIMILTTSRSGVLGLNDSWLCHAEVFGRKREGGEGPPAF